MPGTIPAGSAARAARQATACDYSLVQCDIFKLPSPSPFPGGRGDLGPCKSDDLRQVLIPEVTAIYRWLAELPAAAAGCRPVVGALPGRNCCGHGLVGPGAPADWAREADLGLQVRRIAGPWPPSASIRRRGWNVFRSARTGGSTSTESSMAASATARTSPRPQRLTANVGLHQDPGPLLRAAARTITTATGSRS